jgi:hypothetical protein
VRRDATPKKCGAMASSFGCGRMGLTRDKQFTVRASCAPAKCFVGDDLVYAGDKYKLHKPALEHYFDNAGAAWEYVCKEITNGKIKTNPPDFEPSAARLPLAAQIVPSRLPVLDLFGRCHALIQPRPPAKRGGGVGCVRVLLCPKVARSITAEGWPVIAGKPEPELSHFSTAAQSELFDTEFRKRSGSNLKSVGRFQAPRSPSARTVYVRTRPQRGPYQTRVF